MKNHDGEYIEVGPNGEAGTLRLQQDGRYNIESETTTTWGLSAVQVEELLARQDMLLRLKNWVPTKR